jgi:biotin carboxyl carrier protein
VEELRPFAPDEGQLQLKFEVSHGKDTFHVEVREPAPDVFQVAIDDAETATIDARKTPRTVYSLLIDGRQYEASVDEREDGSLDVHVGTGAFDIHVVDERRRMLVGAAAHVQVGRQELRAQMPGKIVKILVDQGQSVEAAQGIMVIEAMKMENELLSPVAGVVAAIEVAEGDAVETDALLAVIEPPEEDGGA